MSENPPAAGGPAPDEPQVPPPAPDQPQVPPPAPPAGQGYGYPQPPEPAYGAPPPAPAAAGSQLSPGDERTWAGVAHWSALVASLIGLPFLGPLLVLVVQGNKSPFVRRNAVESLNFQLSMMIYALVSAVLILVLIGFFMLLAVGVAWLVFTIMASVKASNGEDYRYPLTIRMVS